MIMENAFHVLFGGGRFGTIGPGRFKSSRTEHRGLYGSYNTGAQPCRPPEGGPEGQGHCPDAGSERLPPWEQPTEPQNKKIPLMVSCTHLFLTRYSNTSLITHVLYMTCGMPQIEPNCLQW